MNESQKRTLRRIIIELAVLLLLLPLQARADTYQCTAELPVEVRTAGSATSELFTITITPEDGAPPAAVDAVQIKGHGTASFTGFVYTAPGDYRYTVRQTKGGTAHMTYDATVYAVTVRVTSRPDRSLGVEIWATGQTGSNKTGLLLFQNRYDPPSPTAVPTNRPTAKPVAVTATAHPVASLPQTGDALPIIPLLLLALASATALFILRRYRK